MRRAVVVALAAVGCGHARPAAVVANEPAPSDAPASVSYEAMVRDGAAWTFRFHQDTQTNDALDPDAIEYDASDPTTTCRVEESVAFATGRAAWIACDDVPDLDVGSRNPLFGTFAVTADGLFRIETMPAAGETVALPAEDALLSSHPVATEHEEELQDEHASGARITAVEERDDAWCAVETYATDYGEHWRLCVDAAGPTGGDWYYQDLESIYSTYFARVDR